MPFVLKCHYIQIYLFNPSLSNFRVSQMKIPTYKLHTKNFSHLKLNQPFSISCLIPPFPYHFLVLYKLFSHTSYEIPKLVWFLKIYYYFYFTILYWFCHTLTWIHHRCSCVPHPEPPSHLPPHPCPLGHPSAQLTAWRIYLSMKSKPIFLGKGKGKTIREKQPHLKMAKGQRRHSYSYCARYFLVLPHYLLGQPLDQQSHWLPQR